MCAFKSFVTAQVLFTLRVAVASKVLIIGDSMGEFAATSLEKFCPGATVNNAAVGGTTADPDWTSGGLLDYVGSETCGGAPDYIWLSVGGNDVLNTQCSASVEDIAAKITASVNAVKAKAPTATILLTGYCVPAAPESQDAGGCGAPEKFQVIANALKQVSDADTSLVYVDSSSACGGSATSWSPQTYFADAIHLNGRGYCKVFRQQGVQTALGCQTDIEFDCDQADCNIVGYDRQCGDGSMTACDTCCGDGGGGDSASIKLCGGSAVLLTLMLFVFIF